MHLKIQFTFKEIQRKKLCSYNEVRLRFQSVIFEHQKEANDCSSQLFLLRVNKNA